MNEPQDIRPRRVRLTSDAVNSYGFRVLTSGIDYSQYARNPVLLWMHERGNVVGTLTDLRVDADGLTAIPVFDRVTERGRQCADQWEAGSLRMVSIGIDVVETSDAPEHLLPGQRQPTVTRCRLFEVSVVDIGANDDAIVLRHPDGSLHMALEATLPTLNVKPQNTPPMVDSRIIEALGLEPTATVDDVVSGIQTLNKAVADLTEDSRRLLTDKVTAMVDEAVAQGRISPDGRLRFVETGVTMGPQALCEMLASVVPAHASAHELCNPSAPADRAAMVAEWNSLDRSGGLAELRKSDSARYAALFEARFGHKPDTNR